MPARGKRLPTYTRPAGRPFGLGNFMAAFTGSVAYSPADYDNDGCPDHMDRNNQRYGC